MNIVVTLLQNERMDLLHHLELNDRNPFAGVLEKSRERIAIRERLAQIDIALDVELGIIRKES